MKKKNLLLLPLAVLLFAFSQTSVLGQSKLFSQPKHLLLPGEKPVENEEVFMALLREKLYPIGWSKDGKFAYLTEPPDEACGCYFVSIFIVDLRTDKILWTEKYDNDGNRKPDNLKDFWRKNQKDFQKLNQYKILPAAKFPLMGTSFSSKSDSFTVDLFSDVRLAADVYSSEGKVEIKLTSSRQGEKTLYQEIYRGENYKGILAAEIGGVLKSPYENKVAVILVQTQRGWEGPPHITKIKIIGADLSGGFKKK